MENILDCNWKIRNKWSRYLTWSEHSAVSDRTKAYNSLSKAHNKETNPQMEQSLLKNRAAAKCMLYFPVFNLWQLKRRARIQAIVSFSWFKGELSGCHRLVQLLSCCFFNSLVSPLFSALLSLFLTWVHLSSLPKRKKKQPRRCLAKLSTSTSVGVHVRVQWAYPAPEIALPCPVALTLPSDGR